MNEWAECPLDGNSDRGPTVYFLRSVMSNVCQGKGQSSDDIITDGQQRKKKMINKYLTY